MRTQPRRVAVLEAAREHADAFLVTTPANVRYLTGFTGSNGQLVCAPEPVFLTDGRYTEQSRAEVPDLERRIYQGAKLAPMLAEVLAEQRIRRLAVEAGHLTVDAHRRLGEQLEGVELVGVADVVEERRMRKDPDEIAEIRGAQRVAEAALTGALARWRGGSEVELALAIEWEMRTTGAEGVSFETIVATGAHAALPHAAPRREPVDTGGVLLIDLGARRGGYCSDMTRTFLGPNAPAELRRAHPIVVQALDAAVAAIRPGVTAGDVDRAAREVLEAEGLGETFVHSTGHGVGLDIHEPPRLAPEAEMTLEVGMVVTVEPGVYLPGVGGIRVEDLIVVGADGPENLTELPRGPEPPLSR